MALGRRMKALRSIGRQDLASKRWEKTLADHSRIKNTPRRGFKGRKKSTKDYNAALKVLRAGEGIGFDYDRDPRMKSAQRCMKKAMMKGSKLKEAFTGCGMSFTSAKSDSAEIRGKKGSQSVSGIDMDNFVGGVSARGRRGSKIR